MSKQFFKDNPEANGFDLLAEQENKNPLGNPMIENSEDPNDDLNPLYKVGGHFE